MVIPPAYTVVKEKDICLFNVKEHYTKFLDQINKQIVTKYDSKFRPSVANKKGGLDFPNKEITSLLRSAATDLIGQIGRKLITGDFNLTTISFPIKVMIPLTILQGIARSLFQFPYFCELAKDKDVLTKVKYTILASLTSFYCSTFFLKPMNPVLGETYEAAWGDGSKIYFEQTSHHPPISHYEIYGPYQNYYLSGYSTFKSSAGLNSLSVYNKGKRSLKFKDGTNIEFNFVKVSKFY